MKKANLTIVSLISGALLVGAFAFGHSNSTDDSRGFGHHMGGMGNMMGMNYDQRLFDVEQLADELGLSNEQITLLSQVEATHIAMQEIMRSKTLDDDGNFSHRGMMSAMSENPELMESHHELLDQFEDSLSENQRSIWQSTNSHCN
jgi:hypothetical protein